MTLRLGLLYTVVLMVFASSLGVFEAVKLQLVFHYGYAGATAISVPAWARLLSTSGAVAVTITASVLSVAFVAIAYRWQDNRRLVWLILPALISLLALLLAVIALDLKRIGW